jgi:hypothetical protein
MISTERLCVCKSVCVDIVRVSLARLFLRIPLFHTSKNTRGGLMLVLGHRVATVCSFWYCVVILVCINAPPHLPFSGPLRPAELGGVSDIYVPEPPILYFDLVPPPGQPPTTPPPAVTEQQASPCQCATHNSSPRIAWGRWLRMGPGTHPAHVCMRWPRGGRCVPTRHDAAEGYQRRLPLVKPQGGSTSFVPLTACISSSIHCNISSSMSCSSTPPAEPIHAAAGMIRRGG